MTSQTLRPTATVRKTPKPSLRSVMGALFVMSAVVATTAAMAVAAQASAAAPAEVAPTEDTSPDENPGGDEGTGTEEEPVPCIPGPPPEVSYSVTDAPPEETGEPAEPEPCPQEPSQPATTTPPPVRINAVGDTINAIEDQALEPYDVTENDVILPSLKAIEVVSGDLPEGLTLWVDNSLEGWVIGTPTECGTFTIEYQVTAKSADAQDGPADSATVVIEVNCASAPVPIEAVDDDLAAAVDQRLEADVVGNDDFSTAVTHIELKTGSLPPGMTLWAGGWLTGTPTETGEFTFTYEAFGAGGSTSIGTISLAVREPSE